MNITVRKYAASIFVLLSVFLLNGNTGCGVSSDTRQFKAAEAEDFSQMGWLEAYDSLHALMQEQYAFGDWKNINWDSLNNTIRPRVILAEAADNASGYATALLEYSRSIPDGHVTWNQPMLGLIFNNINGSYGLGITGLDNGKVIASIVTAGGPADIAGIDVGAEILQWNDVAIATAAAQASTLWRPNPASVATDEHKLLEQYRALALDPVNTQAKIKYLKSDGSGPFTSTLTATDDDGKILTETELWKEIDDDDPITYKILPSGYGYIQLGTLESEDISIDELYDKFKEAMEFLTSNNVPGIIVDLRGDGGDQMTWPPEFRAFFIPKKHFMNSRIFTTHIQNNLKFCSPARTIPISLAGVSH